MPGSLAESGYVRMQILKCAEPAEDHSGACDGVRQKLVDGVAGYGEDALAGSGLNDDEGEDNLKAESPGNCAPADGAAIGREGVGGGEKDDESEKTGETSQSCSPTRGYGKVNAWDECTG